MAVVNQTEVPRVVKVVDSPIRSASEAAIVSTSVTPFPVQVKYVPYCRAKRFLDIVVSFCLMLLLAPVFLIVGLLVWATSPGPALFKQTRVGLAGKTFTCLKFRSMCVDAEIQRNKLTHLNEASGPVFKMKNDPRMTSIGRIIRKFSLDELPQLLNVLRGDMSMVGPRPPVPGEVKQYNEYQVGRLAVRPGLTCLWQINGRSNIPFEHWVELDLLYIETMSFWNDVKIILKTIPAVISGRGAR